MADNYKKYLVPTLFLGIMLLLMIGSSWNDSATFDEKAHIPAGYANFFLGDYRFNPEHPPLIKALAASGLLFTDVNFPTDIPSWQEPRNPGWDPQWDQGQAFLYNSGNDADSILHFMRFPIILLAMVFGWLLWAWTEKRFGHRVAFMTLFLYAFSPTFIAHSRLVTTDLGASFAFFIAIITFVKFLSDPSLKNLFLAGLVLGLAELIKFSLILLVPIYAVLVIGWSLSKLQLNLRERVKLLARLAAKTVAVGAIGLIVIWSVYAYAVWNYPAERELADATSILSTSPLGPLKTFDLALIKNKLSRPLGEYILGVLMVIQRTGGGNTTYYWGEISAAGWRSYFPVVYLAKEPLAFHLLTLIALIFAIKQIIKNGPSSKEKYGRRIFLWIRDHFIEFSGLTFIAVYWLASVSSTLNLGVRHVMPTFPFIYLLVSKEVTAWLRSWRQSEVSSWWDWFKRVWKMYVASIPRYLLVGALMLWQIATVAYAYPNYLSYYNKLGGGLENGYLIAGDSNYDWGQDLKRLKFFVEENGIEKINVDYFGGGDPKYYLGQRFEPWWSARGYPSTSSGQDPLTGSINPPQASLGQAEEGVWLAISVSTLMGAYGLPVKGHQRKPEDSYEWLKPYRPVARAGKSIFIYQLPSRQP